MSTLLQGAKNLLPQLLQVAWGNRNHVASGASSEGRTFLLSDFPSGGLGSGLILMATEAGLNLESCRKALSYSSTLNFLAAGRIMKAIGLDTCLILQSSI
jgi:hypothetical protein